mgnify:CR=1 FL=1
MNKLYRFSWSFRGGDIESLFVATDKELEEALGKDVYFGEVLGKHSEIFGTLEKEDLTFLSEDQSKISWLVETVGSKSICGLSPLEHLSDVEEEFEDGEDKDIFDLGW